MIPPHTLCYEHESLYRVGSRLTAQTGRHAVPATAFDWLVEQSGTWLTFDHVGRVMVLKTQQYVGVIQTPCGHVIEILPKTGKVGQTPAQGRQMLLEMLRHLPDFKHLALGMAHVQTCDMPMLAVFVQLALQSFAQVVQRGLSRRYVSQQANRATLSGRLCVSAQIRYNSAHRERFYTEHDEYSANTPENRLIRAAVLLALRLCPHGAARQLAHELNQRLAEIPASVDVAADQRRVQAVSRAPEYDAALAWAQLLLSGQSPLVGAGAQAAVSLMFDMNRLFERYVTAHVARQLPQGHHWVAQARHHALLQQADGRLHRRLAPDVLYQIDGQNHYIIDAKWKTPRQGGTVAAISSDDLHQMFAYAAAYLPQGGAVCVVYPKTEHFEAAVSTLRFNHIGAAPIELWLIPFCLTQLALVDAPAHLPSLVRRARHAAGAIVECD